MHIDNYVAVLEFVIDAEKKLTQWTITGRVTKYSLVALNYPYPINKVDENLKQNDTFGKSRRILGGHPVGETRPYMVYLRAAPDSNPFLDDATNWLCGGVIIHERYILTSAACIENAKQFYVVSGTHRWIPNNQNDECITNGAKKAVWKCVPKSYFYDGDEFDNIRWMIRDIAVVKVEDDFNFVRRVRGCDFVPAKIAYNNISAEMEKTGTAAAVAGWGSSDSFADQLADTRAGRAAINSPELLEADVVVMSKKNCKSRWDPRYHHIIDEHMVCAKDNMGGDAMSILCTAQEVNCTELVYSMEEEDKESRRFAPNPRKTMVHTPAHGSLANKRRSAAGGGFCENDHGGPLVVGHGKSAVVVGIASACQTFDISLKCHGPFLYTSVYKNRHLINCAITKEMGATCRRLLRSSKTQVTETFFNWPEGSTNTVVLREQSSTIEKSIVNISRTVTPKLKAVDYHPY